MSLTMLSIMDTATTDCLASFQSSILTAQQELQKEQDRLRRLEQTLADTKLASQNTMAQRRLIEHRVEALDTECARLKSSNNSRGAAITATEALLRVQRAPREAAQSEVESCSTQSCAARDAFTDASMNFLRDALELLHPTRNPSVLQAQVAEKTQELLQLRDKVRSLNFQRAAAAERITVGQDLAGSADKDREQTVVGSTNTCTGHSLSAVVSAEAQNLLQRTVDSEQQLRDLEQRAMDARLEHAASIRQLTTQREELRSAVKVLAKRSETSEEEQQRLQQDFNRLANEVSVSMCASCGGPLWILGGCSGHDEAE